MSHSPGIGKTQAFVVVAGAGEDFVSNNGFTLEDVGAAVLETEADVLSDETVEVLEATSGVE